MNAPICACEHEVHTDDQAAHASAVEHAYGNAEACRVLKTAFGAFALCRACVEAGHMTGATPRVHR